MHTALHEDMYYRDCGMDFLLGFKEVDPFFRDTYLRISLAQH